MNVGRIMPRCLVSAIGENAPGTITMEVPLNLSAKTVTQMYQQYQKEELGRLAYPNSEKNLILFRFVLLKRQGMGIDGEGRRSNWRAICQEWNKIAGDIKPGWAFKELSPDNKRVPSSRLREEFSRTEKLLLQSWGERQKKTSQQNGRQQKV